MKLVGQGERENLGWLLAQAALAAAWLIYAITHRLASLAATFAILAFLPALVAHLLADRGPGSVVQRLCRGWSFLRRLSAKARPWMRQKILEGPVFRDPEEASLHLVWRFLQAGLLVPAVVCMAVLQPMFLVALVVLVVPPAGVYIEFLDKARERREQTEAELPFFTSFASALAGTGLSLYHAFTSAARFPSVFERFSWEGRLLRRNVENLGYGVLEGLDDQAFNHPSEGFKRLVLGTTSVWRSGGDMRAVLENRAEEFIAAQEQRWENFADEAGGLGDILGLVFIGLPMALIAVGVCFASLALQGMTVIAFFALPLALVFSYLVLKGSMPPSYDLYSVTHRTVLLWIAPTVTAGTAASIGLGLPTAASIAISIASLGAAVELSLRDQVEEVKDAERSLQRFIRDLTEYRKVGHTIVEGVKRCSACNSYSPRFNNYLRRVATGLSLGLPLFDAGKAARSWLTRITFFLLHNIDESGGGSTVLLEKVMELLRKHDLNRLKATARLRLYTLLAVISPPILVATCALISAMTTGLGFQNLQLAGLRLASEGQIRDITAVAMTAAVESAVSMAFLSTRASEGHPYRPRMVIMACLSFLLAWLSYPTVTGALEVWFAGGTYR